jgi:hypothetical protein
MISDWAQKGLISPDQAVFKFGTIGVTGALERPQHKERPDNYEILSSSKETYTHSSDLDVTATEGLLQPASSLCTNFGFIASVEVSKNQENAYSS